MEFKLTIILDMRNFEVMKKKNKCYRIIDFQMKIYDDIII